MYHYVRDLKNSRYPEIKGMDLKLFKEQVKYLKKHYTIITMEAVIDSLDNNSKLPEKSALLTFDDAYMDHFVNVFPILCKYKIQGSFYTPVKAVIEHTVLDVNKIHFILASVKDILVLIQELKELIEEYREEYNLKCFDFYYGKLAKPNRFDTKEVIFIKRLLQVELIEKLRNTLTDILFEKYVGMSEEAFSRELYMGQEHLEHMVRDGMHIGNHGYNHYWWNRLDEHSLNNEIKGATDFLKSIGVDEKKLTACYPYGSFDERSIKILNDFGYKLAVTTEVDVATTDPEKRFSMPRLDTNDVPKDSNSGTDDWFLKA